MYYFSVLIEGALPRWITAFDNSSYAWVSSFMTAEWTSFMKLISSIGSGWVLTPLTLLFLLVCLRYKSMVKWGWAFALNYAAVTVINHILKWIIGRQRPHILWLVNEIGFSFPSWHAMMAICFFTLLIYLTLRFMKHPSKYLLAGVMGALIPLIGISRVYLGVHYMSDVLGGYVIGLAWVCPYILLLRKKIQ